jgi:hypothetical protein
VHKLVNHERAIEIMEREGLDGLVAVLPVNSYYLSSYWGLFNTPVGYDGSYFAILPRDPAAPHALIVPALEIRRLETERSKGAGNGLGDGSGTWMDNIYAYSSVRDDEVVFADGTPRGIDYEAGRSRMAARLRRLSRAGYPSRSDCQRKCRRMPSGRLRVR